jgi:hypothetical protein
MNNQKSPNLEQYQLALISLMHFSNDISQQEIATVICGSLAGLCYASTL